MHVCACIWICGGAGWAGKRNEKLPGRMSAAAKDTNATGGGVAEGMNALLPSCSLRQQFKLPAEFSPLLQSSPVCEEQRGDGSKAKCRNLHLPSGGSAAVTPPHPSINRFISDFHREPTGHQLISMSQRRTELHKDLWEGLQIAALNGQTARELS